MNNFVSDGEILLVTAPYNADAGTGVQVGGYVFGVACADLVSGATGQTQTCGVFDLAKVSAQAWTAGDTIYWDNSAKNCTTTASSNLPIGYAVADAANPSSTGRVILQQIGIAGAGGEMVALCYNGLSSKASDAAVARFVAPVAGTITLVQTVLNGALATGDATFTTAIAGTGVTGGVVTATQSGSAAGDVDSATPTALNTVAVGDLITVTGGGSSSATATANVQVLIRRA